MLTKKNILSDIDPNISFINILEKFRFALSNKDYKFLIKMWVDYPLLQQWYNGKEIIFGNDEFSQPIIRSISDKELIEVFKTVLKRKEITNIVKEIWDKNKCLQEAIANLSLKDSTRLLNIVISTHLINEKEDNFCVQYIEFIKLKHEQIIFESFSKLKERKKPRKGAEHHKKQIELLTKYLPSDVIYDKEIDISVSEQQTTKKRKSSLTSPRKKQKTSHYSIPHVDNQITPSLPSQPISNLNLQNEIVPSEPNLEVLKLQLEYQEFTDGFSNEVSNEIVDHEQNAERVSSYQPMISSTFFNKSPRSPVEKLPEGNRFKKK